MNRRSTRRYDKKEPCKEEIKKEDNSAGNFFGKDGFWKIHCFKSVVCEVLLRHPVEKVLVLRATLVNEKADQPLRE